MILLQCQETRIKPTQSYRRIFYQIFEIRNPLLNVQKTEQISLKYIVPGSDSSCKWESVGTENKSVTDVLKLRGVLTKSSK